MAFKKRSVLSRASNFTLVFLWVLTGGSVLAVFQRNILLALLFVLSFSLIVLGTGKIKRSHIGAFFFGMIIVSICLAVCYIFSIPPQDGTKYLFIGIEFFVSGVVCLYFFSAYSYAEFQAILFKVLKFIRWHALVSAVLISFLPSLFSLHIVYDYTNYNADSFLMLFFKLSKQFSFDIGGLSLTRNQGLFWEPGVLQFYLNLFFFLQLYVFKSKNLPIALTVMAIVSTYSTSAYLIMLVIASVAFFKQIKRRPAIYIPLSLIILSLFIPFLIGNLENKFEGEHQTSSAVRVFDVVQQLEIIQDHIFDGVGLDDDQFVKVRTKYKIPGYFENPTEDQNASDRGSTNSILFLLAATGLPIGLLWLYAYIKQPFIKQRKFLIAFLLITGVFVEPLLLKPFFLTFLIGGFMAIYYKLRYRTRGTLWLKDKTIVQ